MSTIKSSADHIVINADGASKDIKFQANGVEKAVIDSSGNVGIGVTPESGWHSSLSTLQFGGLGSLHAPSSTAAGNDINLVQNGYTDGSWKHQINDESSLYRQANGTHEFRVAPSGTADAAISWTTAMTIENDGDILFGAANAYEFGWTFKKDGELYHKRTGTSSQTHIYFANANGSVGTIQTSGSSTSYNESSDYRLKENVVPMTGSIDKLKQLKPCNFNFIVAPYDLRMGFLAHEAQEVVPQAITGTKDAMMTEEYEVTPEVKETVTIPAVEAVEAVLDDEGNVTTEAVQAQDEYTEERVVTEAVMGEREVPDYQGIDQSKLVPLLVASLQEAIARIEVLEAQLNA
jgi:hypothetical protein